MKKWEKKEEKKLILFKKKMKKKQYFFWKKGLNQFLKIMISLMLPRASMTFPHANMTFPGASMAFPYYNISYEKDQNVIKNKIEKIINKKMKSNPIFFWKKTTKFEKNYNVFFEKK